MKTHGRLLITALAFIGLTFSISTEAASLTFTKVDVSLTSPKLKAVALETVYGEKISLFKIKNIPFNKPGNAKELLKKAQIELKNDQVIYPEEIASFLVKEKKGVHVLREPSGGDDD